MTDTHATTIMTAPTTAPERMHPLVSAAMRSGALADPATLRELLAVQREWEAGEARKAYARALAALKRDLPTVIDRDSTVDFTSKAGARTFYTHSSLAGVMDAITGPLTQHGFSLSWVTTSGERGSVRVTCRLTHSEGHQEDGCALEAPPDTSGSKSPAQAIASTITLLERYTALATLGIATKDMPEPAPRPDDAPKDVGDVVDPGKNLRAAKWLADRGIAREEVERRIGRPVSEWTAADLEAVRAFAKPPAETKPSAAKPLTEAEKVAARERGEDPNA